VRRRPLSIGTVGHVHGLLKVALNTAIQWKQLKFNPALGCTLPKKKSAKREDLDLIFCGPDGDYLKPDSVSAKIFDPDAEVWTRRRFAPHRATPARDTTDRRRRAVAGHQREIRPRPKSRPPPTSRAMRWRKTNSPPPMAGTP
jgi:hypothetical protein